MLLCLSVVFCCLVFLSKHLMDNYVMIMQAQELLSAEGGADLTKLRHKREALAAKVKLLRKSDEEIVEAVHGDELEEEVDGADTV